MNENHSTGEAGGSFPQRSLPRWDELPDLELYMDQVLSLMERYLGAVPGPDGRGLTASMVNNYVKLGVIPPPVKKKYTREHLAHLVILCTLKAALPIAVIQGMIASELENAPTETVYDRFCALFEGTGEAVAASLRQLSREDNALGPIWHAAMRAQAEQALALRLYEKRI